MSTEKPSRPVSPTFFPSLAFLLFGVALALAFVVAAGDITALMVSCEVDVQRGLLLYDVSFTDPRLDRRARIRGEV